MTLDLVLPHQGFPFDPLPLLSSLFGIFMVLTDHFPVEKPWGSYTILVDEKYTKVKKYLYILVNLLVTSNINFVPRYGLLFLERFMLV